MIHTRVINVKVKNQGTFDMKNFKIFLKSRRKTMIKLKDYIKVLKSIKLTI